jgi:tRNA-dihydrouridine synthase A
MEEKISIAPMVEWTDPHYRMLMRGLTKRTVLYTEMVVDDAVINTPNLDFIIGREIDAAPSVIQLGGSNPETLALAAERCEQYSNGSFNEINLNCGCPSQRVAKKCFGAKLMLEPDLVGQIVHQMQRRTSLPITVKCRLGVDDADSYPELTQFIRSAHEGGASKFIIHARKCLLNGLSTKQNRDIPPLHYEVVHRLARDFSGFMFIINGGIQSFDQGIAHFDPYEYADFAVGQSVVSIDHNNAATLQSLRNETIEHLPGIHGVMIGRAAYNNPLMFATADSTFHSVSDPCLSRRQILERYMTYCDWAQSDAGPKRTIKGKEQSMSTMSLLNSMRNIIHGIKNVALFRQTLNDEYMRLVKINTHPSTREIIEKAMETVLEEDLDAPLGRHID